MSHLHFTRYKTFEDVQIHSLTGLFNQVHMVEDLKRAFTKQLNERKPISKVAFDLKLP